VFAPYRVFAGEAGLKPVQLTTDLRANPIGISSTPVFGWNLQPVLGNPRNQRQVGYRLRIANSEANLRDPATLLWDSGKINSSTYWQRPYDGPPLESSTVYYWKVQVWSDGGGAGPWSEVARFTTALLSQHDWLAHWIAAEPDRTHDESSLMRITQPDPLPVFRHDFDIQKRVISAFLFAAGLGQYEVRLNGVNVTDTVLNSGWTNYRKTVLYNSYNVKDLLHPGINAFGVLLGNGMYNVEGVAGHYTKFTGSFGQPKCLLQLDVRYADGTRERFFSDGSWQTHAGPVLYSSTYGGEEFDGGALPPSWDHAGFQSDGWEPALEVSGPGGRLMPDRSSPMIIAQTYTPVRTTRLKPRVTVYDLGKNMSGWPSITVKGPAGSRVQLLLGELLNPDGTVSQRSANASAADPVLFSYILRGGRPETWHPRFAYYSFRYVQVKTEAAPGSSSPPWILSLAGEFVHAKSPVVGNFSSSNELFQRIHTLIDRAVLSNLASVVTDCPSREKLGWLEQTYLNAATLMFNYDVTGIYEKMGDDMRDAQLSNGLVPSIAPEFVAFVDEKGKDTAFRDSPEWGSAIVLSPWSLYQFTGDTRPLSDNYEAMQRYVAHLQSKSSQGLLDYGLGDWYDIGPKEPGPSQLTNKMVTATGVFYEDLSVLADVAALLGHMEDAANYTKQAAAVRNAFNAKLFDPTTNQYDRGSQTANAVPLALGLVPADRVHAVLDHLVADVHAHGDHVTAGDVGFHYVVRALTDNGRSDVLAAMFSRVDSPSYGYQLARGATTLTEAWDANPLSSQNHFMLGHGEEWFYRGLAGLSINMALGVDNALQLHPSFLDGLSHASASYRSPMGPVQIAWRRAGTQLSVDVSVPVGATAHLLLPAGIRWRESNELAIHARGVSHSDETAGILSLTLGSGRYHFSGVV
jgi:hypothetical protein